MTLLQIPKFQFPPMRTAMDVAELANNKEALTYLSELEAARRELNKHISTYNKLEQLDSDLAKAQVKQTQASAWLDGAKKQSKEILNATRKEAEDLLNASKHQISEDRNQCDKELQSTKALLGTAKDQLAATEAKIVDLERTHRQKADQERHDLDKRSEELAVMRVDYEGKIGRLKDAIADV